MHAQNERTNKYNNNCYSSPHWVMIIGSFGRLFCPVETFSILRTVNIPSRTWPENTTTTIQWTNMYICIHNARAIKYNNNQWKLNCLPNTTCFPSNHSHLLHVMKNWHPLVCAPNKHSTNCKHKWIQLICFHFS